MLAYWPNCDNHACHFLCHYWASCDFLFSVHTSIWFWRSGTITVVLFVTLRNNLFVFLHFALLSGGIVFIVYFLFVINHSSILHHPPHCQLASKNYSGSLTHIVWKIVPTLHIYRIPSKITPFSDEFVKVGVPSLLYIPIWSAMPKYLVF